MKTPFAWLAIGAAACTSTTPLGTAPDATLAVGRDTRPYLVEVRRGQSLEGVAQGHAVRHRFRTVLHGFSADLPPQAVEALQRNPTVTRITPVGMMTVNEPAASWGLDRIDQRSVRLDGTYSFASTGAGVRVYVVDTGIDRTHPDFQGRAVFGVDVTGLPGGGDADCYGHGTHVAGTVASRTYGVAKAAIPVSVRVFGCVGEAPDDVIIAGIEWATQDAAARGIRAVGNLSLGGRYYQPLNDAVEASTAAGITWAVAAGNERQDACNTSPASAPNAVTVGASTTTENCNCGSGPTSDLQAYFTNYGSCVDVYAPGMGIPSTASGGGLATMSGTSMAAPHVAGAAARYLQTHPSATPAQITAWLKANATWTAAKGKAKNSAMGQSFPLLYVPPAI